MAASRDTPFADLSRSKAKERAETAARRRADLVASLSRLVKDEDFRAWFTYVNLEFCGSDFGLNELDAFTQGKRAAMTFLKESIAIAEGGPAFLGLVHQRHFAALAEARMRAMTDNEGEAK